MTRGELVAELLGLWEESAQRMNADGYAEACKHVRIAIGVLERTYSAEELVGSSGQQQLNAHGSYCQEYD
jgi:hypothetical protein